MKALTLTQPWATLVALGHKRVETRSWSTKYRGPLAIHAAKGYPAYARGVAAAEYANPRGLLAPGTLLALGGIVARARLVDVRRTEEVVDRLSAQEQRLGNYAPGRFAWFLEDIDPTGMIPAVGKLGLWDWREESPEAC